MIKRALISVYEKKGLGDLVKKLCEFGVKILSSRGTGEKLRELGYPVTDIITYTGYPEMPDALVKTLHPQIHGGILLNPSNPIHHAYMKEQGIEKIDMVVVNFYPLPKMKTYNDIMLRDAAKHIDIGGPALARAAAKAAFLYETLTVVTDADQYKLVINELEKNLHALGIFHVERNAALVAVCVLKVIVIALHMEFSLDRLHVASGRIAFYRFYFDYFGSEISQPHSSDRSLLECSDFNNLNSRQRSLRHGIPPDYFHGKGIGMPIP